MKTMKNALMGLVVASATIMTVNAATGVSVKAGTAIEAGLAAKLQGVKGMEPVLQAVQTAQASGKLNLTNAGEAKTFLNSIASSIPGLSPALQAQLKSEGFLNEVMTEANAFVSSAADYNPTVAEADPFGAVGSVANSTTCELAEIGMNKKPMTEEQRKQAAEVSAGLDEYVQTLVASGKLAAKEVPAFRAKIAALYGVGNTAATTDDSVTEEEAAQLSAGLRILVDELAVAAANRTGEHAVDCGLYDAYQAAASGKGESAEALSASAASFVGACGTTFGGGTLTAENAASVCAR